MLRWGELGREVLRVAWPMIVSQVAESLYAVLDTFFVSRLGTTAVAALALGSYMSWLLFVVVALFSTGTMVFVAQSYGAKELEKARRAIGQTMIMALAVSAAAGVCGWLASEPLARLVGGSSPSVVEQATRYFRIRSLGLPASALAMVVDSSVRAVGATKLSMIATVSSAALNMVLDPILIYGLLGLPKLGVAGAALAMVLSIAYMIPLELAFLKRLGVFPRLTLGIGYALRVARIGIPTATERLVFAIGNNIYIAFISRCGSIALAAHQIGLRIESFVYMPGFAFSIAAAALVGHRVGKGSVGEGKSAGLEAAKIGAALMTITGVGLAAIAPIAVKPFTTNPEVAKLATIYLILAGLSEPGLALAMILSNAIRGGGNTLVPMLVNAIGLYLFRVAPSYIATKTMGVIGAWIAMFIDVYARGITFLILYKKKFHKLAKKVI
ncbi:MAG: MATE family efflux transporter [Crenarchaeota archaeon]|nr:MATE family efflux transporter [Thermoproteota archaeon]